MDNLQKCIVFNEIVKSISENKYLVLNGHTIYDKKVVNKVKKLFVDLKAKANQKLVKGA